jgi:hypothetical protein
MKSPDKKGGLNAAHVAKRKMTRIDAANSSLPDLQFSEGTFHDNHRRSAEPSF